jgi:hypothetical protein
MGVIHRPGNGFLYIGRAARFSTGLAGRKVGRFVVVRPVPEGRSKLLP